MKVRMICTSNNFYPRSPCGERPAHCFDGGEASGISIHALLAESDYSAIYNSHCKALFLSTLSLRRATCAGRPRSGWKDISIHALLAESDSQPCCTDTTSTISIHALLAESDINRVKRLLPSWISIHALLAESDHDSYVIMEATKVISIHALLAESDCPPAGKRLR